MDEVGRRVASHCLDIIVASPATFLVYAGKGNNAGDALVAAGQLAEQRASRGEPPIRVLIRLAGDAGELGPLPRKKLAALSSELFPRVGPAEAMARLPSGDRLLIVDGLLGVGARGPLREPLLSAAREINHLRQTAGAYVVAIDIPSGLDTDSGEAAQDTVVADETLTIGFAKTGLVADGAPNYTGRLSLIGLRGFDPFVSQAPEAAGRGALITPASLAGLLPPRVHDSNKGMYGRVGILAGSVGATGAAVMCSHACARAGAGLITLLVAPDIYPIVAAAAAPEVMVKPLSSPIEALDMNFDVLALGPGLGQSSGADVRQLIERWPKPMVIDADGLNALSEDISPLRQPAGPRLLTPHPGEMQRLRKGDAAARKVTIDGHAPRARIVREFTDHYPVTLLLKGARTLVGELGRAPAYNTTGNGGHGYRRHGRRANRSVRRARRPEGSACMTPPGSASGCTDGPPISRCARAGPSSRCWPRICRLFLAPRSGSCASRPVPSLDYYIGRDRSPPTQRARGGAFRDRRVSGDAHRRVARLQRSRGPGDFRRCRPRSFRGLWACRSLPGVGAGGIVRPSDRRRLAQRELRAGSFRAVADRGGDDRAGHREHRCFPRGHGRDPGFPGPARDRLERHVWVRSDQTGLGARACDLSDRSGAAADRRRPVHLASTACGGRQGGTRPRRRSSGFLWRAVRRPPKAWWPCRRSCSRRCRRNSFFAGISTACCAVTAGVPAGILINAALFAGIHLNAPSFAGLFVLAVCLTLAYEWTGSLLVPMAMHALFNSISIVNFARRSKERVRPANATPFRQRSGAWERTGLWPRCLPRLAPSKPGAAVHTGAGDDCAVVRPPGAGQWQLLKTDCVIEGVHFASGTPPARIGWKALCRPLSDIAAMGGKPEHALVTLALSAESTLAFARGIYTGIGRAAREFGVTVVGGETARSPGPCFISVCVTGSVARRRCIPRSGGRAGDRLYVTGRLGGSFQSGRHYSFRPRLEEGRWLAAKFPVRAMMDISDGLAADLPRLALASGTGFELRRDALPRAPGCSVEQALGDGEDYELLFAIGRRTASRLENRWPRKFPRLALTCVGQLAAAGENTGLEAVHGYDHFGGSSDANCTFRPKTAVEQITI